MEKLPPGLTRLALDVAGGDGARALLAVIQVTRYALIVDGEIQPAAGERLPPWLEQELART